MTETASDTSGQMSSDATPARPTTDDADAWKAYWSSQGMPWRTEPEISTERQAYLAERRPNRPDIEHDVYPFKDIEPKLTRADIEWLLATHKSRGVGGPVKWEQEKDKPKDERPGAGPPWRRPCAAGLDPPATLLYQSRCGVWRLSL